MTADDAAGLVVVHKPGGITSHDVVARLRRLADTRKVGHAGTLDPMATGVLLIGVNRATRLLGHLMLTRKGYDATIRLGVNTTTDDAEGDIVSQTSAAGVSEEAIRAALALFVGDIEQVPSAVSAIKVNGQRAYDLVRAGEQVTLAARPVTIDSLEVGSVRRDEERVDVDISVACSSGTYIRAIARDLGATLGVGGHLAALQRTSVGPFDLADASTLEQLAEKFEMVPIAEVAARCFPSYTLDDEETRAVAVGRKLEIDLGSVGPVALFDQGGTFMALYEQQGSVASAVAVFVG